MPIGYSFQPGSETLRLNQQGGRGVSGLSPQEAVKFLSLRLPERPSPTAIAPQALLQARGGQGAPMGGDAQLRAVIAGLMQLFSGGPPSSQPTPRVRPPIEDPGANQPGDLGQAPPTIPPQDFPNPGMGDLGPAPTAQPPQDFPVPEGPLASAPPFSFGDAQNPSPIRTAYGRKQMLDYAPPLL